MNAIVLRDGFYTVEPYKLLLEDDKAFLRVGASTVQLDTDWEEIRKRVEYKRRIIIAERDGRLLPVRLIKEVEDEETDSWEFLNSDRRRQIKRSVGDIKNLARSKWDKIRDISIAALIIVAVVATIIVTIGIISKFGIDQANAFRGVFNADIVNATRQVLGG